MENNVTSYISDRDETNAKGEPDLDVQTFLRDFRDAYDDTQIEREVAMRCRDYYDGYQLTEDELATLRQRKQPPVVFNRIGPKVDTLIGWEKKLRTDPKAFPRVPSKEDDANSCTDALRFVAQQNKFDQIRSAVFENLTIEGAGAAKVIVKEKGTDDAYVCIVDIPWDRLYRDPHSRDRMFADAAYLGEVIWMYDQDVIDTFSDYGDKDDIESIVNASYNEEWNTGTYGDRPRFSFADSKRRRIMVMHHRFRQDGEWWSCVFCRGGFLVNPAVSEYEDEYGQPDCDIVATSTYIDQNNRRYGAVKRLLDPQDEINKRRSKALHASNSTRVKFESGAVKSVYQMRLEMAKPDGAIEVRPGKQFDILPEPQLYESQMQMLQEAKAEIDAIGVNPALGGDTQAPSGRAQQMLQQAGLTEYAKLFEAVDQWALTIYQKVWFRVRQYWTAERWIRVTDDERNLRWVQLNHPVTLGEALMMVAKKRDISPVQAATEYMQDTGQQLSGPNDPALQQVIRTQNDIGQLDVDIILDEAPEAVTVQAEQFTALVQFSQSTGGSIPPTTLIKASSLRNKDEILRDMQGQLPPQAQAQMQAMQQQTQGLQQQNQALIAQLQRTLVQLRGAQQNNDVDMFKAQHDAMTKQTELFIEQYNAETARMKVMAPIPLEAVPLGWPADAQVPGNYATGPAHSPASGVRTTLSPAGPMAVAPGTGL